MATATAAEAVEEDTPMRSAERHFHAARAPDFISQGVFTEFWEILHLLFIGIAVSYGLFCRKCHPLIDADPVPHSRTEEPRAYFSGIDHLSSFFDDGFESMTALDERDSTSIYGRDKPAVHEGSQIRALNVNGYNFGGNAGSVNQSWCSQYLKSESLLVVSSGKKLVGESSEIKPLNLPIRSLRSSIVDTEKLKSNCSPKIEANGDEDTPKVLKLRGVAPINLEKKFDEVAGPSPIPWRSNSSRAGSREDKNNAKVHAHSRSRPHSVGEFEFERIKSSSYPVPKFSTSPELVSPTVESVEQRNGFSGSRSKVAPLNGEGLPFSENGWLFNEENDRVGKGKHAIESLESGFESSAFGNLSSKPKSVRTIKPRRYAMEEQKQFLSQMDQRLGRIRKQSEAAENSENQATGDEQESPLSEAKSKFNEFGNEEKEGVDNRNDVSEHEEEIESKVSEDPLEDDPKTNLDIDSELEGSEVDRKAGEFIAKFREQIRLQKVTLTEG
ncbi:uncharacterized protein LOC127263400 isoform X2 [Andrographis paniculata]|uniref:uncharacterized protein LOC127263400 isoform X2 n=1 Tax=Andrographis paniculata TaxID=175694 RepID=UPI0021E8DA6E|nr:uncharacterized protein LOC127263400 isoform X2 [Andrographis paniculata]